VNTATEQHVISGIRVGSVSESSLLEHSATSMSRDYTHASSEEMEQAMELVAAYKGQSFFNLGKPKKSGDQPSAVAL